MYLEHHGIKGQKWGVRRYQNADGTLTNEGRVRYSVNRKAKSIQERLSSSYKPFEKEAIDINVVKARGSLTQKEAIKCSKLASDIFDTALKKEPKITKDVVEAVTQSGSKMYGLSCRLKQPTSLAAKIGADAKSENIDFDRAAGKITDTIRYTSVSPLSDFTNSYMAIKQKMESTGYSEIRCKNYFQRFKDGKVSHKAIQSVYESKDGTRFELQFQTLQSQAVKELKLPLYNEVRQSNVSKSRKQQLIQLMNQMGNTIIDPDGVFRIKDY